MIYSSVSPSSFLIVFYYSNCILPLVLATSSFDPNFPGNPCPPTALPIVCWVRVTLLLSAGAWCSPVLNNAAGMRTFLVSRRFASSDCRYERICLCLCDVSARQPQTPTDVARAVMSSIVSSNS